MARTFVLCKYRHHQMLLGWFLYISRWGWEKTNSHIVKSSASSSGHHVIFSWFINQEHPTWRENSLVTLDFVWYSHRKNVPAVLQTFFFFLIKTHPFVKTYFVEWFFYYLPENNFAHCCLMFHICINVFHIEIQMLPLWSSEYLDSYVHMLRLSWP